MSLGNAYEYDGAGRLAAVTVDGNLASQYGYDENGNRTSTTASGTSFGAVYDAQDRLLSYGDATYIFGPNGDLQQRTRASEANATHYTYDVLGNLVSVVLPDGKQIEYIIDAQNRRVGKKVNGILTQGFLYDGQLRIVAELDGSNVVASRFVYATQGHSPDYFVKGGVTYRMVKNHLGSIRLVVNTSDGTVAQRMDYDEWGNLTSDTSPGFQPFGFAGGLYDSETKLTRFGLRDYDAETGRWTTKDPIRFAGGNAGLYVYVANNPMNIIDPSGLCFSTKFMDVFEANFRQTNDFFFSFPTSLSRTALGILTSGAVAKTFGTVTPVEAIRSLLNSNLGVGRGVATLGVSGTLAAAGLNMAINTVAVTLALETGIAIGSAADALGQALADDSPCPGDTCGGSDAR
jgi:RHS repeat-associated protein